MANGVTRPIELSQVINLIETTKYEVYSDLLGEKSAGEPSLPVAPDPVDSLELSVSVTRIEIRVGSSELERPAARPAETLTGLPTGTIIRSREEERVSASVQASVRTEAESDNVKEKDPVVIDLDGDGVEFQPYKDGGRFDIDGDGELEQTGFVTGDDGFLVYDRNGNGRLDNGRELIGDQYGHTNGFEMLREFDTNADGMISPEDATYSSLRIYRSRNGNPHQGEMLSLPDVGIERINLDYQDTDENLESGDRLTQRSRVTMRDGSTRTAADVMIRYLDR